MITLFSTIHSQLISGYFAQVKTGKHISTKYPCQLFVLINKGIKKISNNEVILVLIRKWNINE